MLACNLCTCADWIHLTELDIIYFCLRTNVCAPKRLCFISSSVVEYVGKMRRKSVVARGIHANIGQGIRLGEKRARRKLMESQWSAIIIGHVIIAVNDNILFPQVCLSPYYQNTQYNVWCLVLYGSMLRERMDFNALKVKSEGSKMI